MMLHQRINDRHFESVRFGIIGLRQPPRRVARHVRVFALAGAFSAERVDGGGEQEHKAGHDERDARL